MNGLICICLFRWHWIILRWLLNRVGRVTAIPRKMLACCLRMQLHIASPLTTFTVTPLLTMPRLWSASDVTIATPPWPAAWHCPLTPEKVTFGLRVTEGGGVRGQRVRSCLKTVKALHWLAIICPFHTLISVIGILTNWPLDIVSSTLSSLHGAKCSVGGLRMRCYYPVQFLL